jgi:arylsulfatase A-like enzyme
VLAAELAGLCGLAFVQPVLGPFGASPETFSAFGATRGTIVAFALVVALVPLLCVWAVAAASRVYGDAVRERFQTGVVALLAGLAASYLLGKTGLPGLVVAAGAVAAGVGVAVARQRWGPARLFLRYLSPLPILVAGVFLFASPVAPLVMPAPERTASGTASSDRPPIVLIVLDELPTLSLVDRNGDLDAALVPNLARFADTSTWYRNHTAISPTTGTSLPVMLTGEMPKDPTHIPTPNATEFPDNLLARMSDTYEVNGAEWSTSFCPDDLCPRPDELSGTAASFLRAAGSRSTSPLRSLLDEGRSLWWSQTWPLADDFDGGFSFGGTDEIDDQRRRSLEFLDGIDEPSGDRPVFDYLHSALPHQPWNLLPTGQSYNGPETPHGEFLRGWPEGDFGKDLAAAARQQHLLQVQMADRLLGAVFERIREVGRWDDALVIVTADHGVSFQPGAPVRDAIPSNEVDMAWAPLLVKLPGQSTGSIDDTAVNALDLLPTVLDVAGIEDDDDLPGRSLATGKPVDDGSRSFISTNETAFDHVERKGVVTLDADGLAVLRSGGAREGYLQRDPGDALAVWRQGRHGDLLGRKVADLGVCAEPGPAAQRTVPEDWDAYTAGSLPSDAPLPLWQSGTVATKFTTDVAAVVDGTFAGWGVTIPEGDGSRFGLLVAEPLVPKGAGPPELYQIVDQPGCRLRHIEG